jgi:hypothetical protein
LTDRGIELVQSMKRLDEHVLGNILGVIRTGKEPVNETEHRAGVATDQHLEGISIPVANPPDCCLVIHPLYPVRQ